MRPTRLWAEARDATLVTGDRALASVVTKVRVEVV
jgi:hypothetical protein